MTKTTAIQIVRARLEHLDQVAPMFDAYRQFYGQAADAAAAKTFMNQRLSAGDSVVFLARVDEKPAGFAQLFPTFTSVSLGRVWHMNDLYVQPAVRRSGVGRSLVLHAMEFAQRTGAARVTLETAKDNEPAQKLYEGLGFEKGEKFWKYSRTVGG